MRALEPVIVIARRNAAKRAALMYPASLRNLQALRFPLRFCLSVSLPVPSTFSTAYDIYVRSLVDKEQINDQGIIFAAYRKNRVASRRRARARARH
jgi:hypothetical protein